MTSWMEDEGLMAELATAIGQEREVPDHRRQAAYGAFAWRTVDQDLLTLMHDSSLQETAAVRGDEDARTLSFSGSFPGGGVSLELEVDGSTLTGQVLPPASTGEVTMERADGESRTVHPDASGFFALPDASGTVRFAVETDGNVRRTEWIVL
jgi:hypothetical protein